MGSNLIKKYENAVKVEVEIALLKEENTHVAYCPALEISAYGDNPDEAIYSFRVNLKIFLEDALKKGTLERTLLSLGWRLQQKPKAKYNPPKVSHSDLWKRIGSKPNRFRTERIAIPFLRDPHNLETPRH